MNEAGGLSILLILVAVLTKINKIGCLFCWFGCSILVFVVLKKNKEKKNYETNDD